jgi:plastocyanin
MTLLRRARILLGLTLLALVTPLGSAVAAGPVITVDDFAFTPGHVRVAQGGTVTWRFLATHTSTSDQGFWDSGDRGSGTYVVTFRDAGTFGFHCAIHPDMTGAVAVPLRATGGPAVGYRVHWTTRTSTPASRRYDVQYRRAGTTRWLWFRQGSATRVGRFDPARAGGYVLRARTRNVGVGVSGWSPTLSLRIS